MRLFLIFSLFLVLGCSQESDTTALSGVASISNGSKCENVNLQVKGFIKTLLDDLERPPRVGEAVVGVNIELQLSSRAKDIKLERLPIKQQIKLFRNLFFTDTYLEHDLAFDFSSSENTQTLNATIGLLHDNNIEMTLIDEQEKTFGKAGECETTVTYRAQWSQAKERVAIKGTVQAIRPEGELTPISGRIYMTRLGPGRMGQKFSAVVEGGKYYMPAEVLAGHYRVELNEKVSPNYRLLAKNTIIFPRHTVQQDFALKFPCRWNIQLEGHIDQYESFLWMWGDWKQKMSGRVLWNMMPIGIVDICHEHFPILDQAHEMELYNQRYNLRTEGEGFRSLPILKIYRDIDQEEVKLFVGIHLKDRYDFGQGKTNYLTMINSCSTDNREAELKDCFQDNLSRYLQAGEKFSVQLGTEIDKELRANFRVTFEPLF